MCLRPGGARQNGEYGPRTSTSAGVEADERTRGARSRRRREPSMEAGGEVRGVRVIAGESRTMQVKTKISKALLKTVESIDAATSQDRVTTMKNSRGVEEQFW